MNQTCEDDKEKSCADWDDTLELSVSVEELQRMATSQHREIARLQGVVKQLEKRNFELKKESVQKQEEFEKEQECIANKLLWKIDELQKSKSDIYREVEVEEEFLTNSLQKKLTQLQREKVELENALEQEQEYMVHKLQQQLEVLRSSSPALSSPSMTPRLSFSASNGELYHPTTLIESMKRDNNMLKLKLVDQEQRYTTELRHCKQENETLRNQVFILRKKLMPSYDEEKDKENAMVPPPNLPRAKRSQSLVAKNKPATSYLATLKTELRIHESSRPGSSSVSNVQ